MKPQHRLSAAPRHELRNVRNQGIALLALAFLFSIFVNLLMLTGPLFMLQVYDRVLGSRAVETLTAQFLLVALILITIRQKQAFSLHTFWGLV